MKHYARSPRAVASAHPPENYLASVSDLMVGLLFIFILMLMAFALDSRPIAAPIAAPVTASATSAPTAAPPLTATPIPAVVASPLPDTVYLARDRAILDIQKELLGRGIRVQVDLANGVVRLPEELLFDQGTAAFRPGGAVAIKKISSELLFFLPHGPSLEAVLVEGHSDNTPIRGLAADDLGTYRDNWDLSYQRAKQTYLALIQATPELGRLRNDHGQPVLSVGAYGPIHPVASNLTPEGRRLNRRIDLRVILAPATYSTLKRSTP